MVVIATYAVNGEQQHSILALIRSDTPLVVQSIRLLTWIWESPDSVFGLKGLARVMEGHNANIIFG